MQMKRITKAQSQSESNNSCSSVKIYLLVEVEERVTLLYPAGEVDDVTSVSCEVVLNTVLSAGFECFSSSDFGELLD